jgi:hypothetical protein
VAFLGARLGVSLAEPLDGDPSALPVVAAVDVAVAAASVAVGGGGPAPSDGAAGESPSDAATAAAERLPAVGDRLVSVNGQRLASTRSSEELYDAALSQIAKTGRPLVLGFVRSGAAGAAAALAAAAKVEEEAEAAAEAFFRAMEAADSDSDGGVVYNDGPRVL